MKFLGRWGGESRLYFIVPVTTLDIQTLLPPSSFKNRADNIGSNLFKSLWTMRLWGNYIRKVIISLLILWQKHVQEANILFWVLFSEIKVLKNNCMLLQRCEEIRERLWDGHFVQTRQKVGLAYCMWWIHANIQRADTVQTLASNIDKGANCQVLTVRCIPQLMHANDIAYLNWPRMIHPKILIIRGAFKF